jgi:hypothetical protein
VNADIVGEVLAAVGLDVEDGLHAAVLDGDDLLLTQRRAGLAVQLQRGVQSGRLAGRQEADLGTERRPLRAHADLHLEEVGTVGTGIGLAEPTRVDAEPQQQQLDVLGPALADDSEGHAPAAALHGDVPVGLEEAAQIGGDGLVGGVPEPGRHPQLVPPSQQAPGLHERTQDLAVESDAAAGERGVGGLERPDVLVDVGEDDL